MSEASALRFDQNSMPHAYDEYLVPRLYTPWARKLLETAKLGPNHHLLDVACGTGAVARLAGPVVGMRGRAVAQISRVLQKGGRIGASIWGSLETCHFWHALAIAFKKSIPPLNEELLKANAFTGAEALGELLEAVGFIKVEIHTEKMPMVFRRRCCAGSASRARHTLRSEDIRVGYHPARVRSGGETGL